MTKKRQSRSQRQSDLERKRDERSARRALQRERKLGEYLDKTDEDFVSFANQLEVLGLRIKDIPGDGNCLFRALADQLEGDMTQHARHRRETVQYMLDHPGDFEPFVEDDVPFDKHTANLAKEGTFGGNDSIVAFSRNHKVDVVIHQHNAPALHIHGCDIGIGGQIRVLNLSYHNGEHYSSVRRIGEAAGAGPGGQVHSAVNPTAQDKKKRKGPGGSSTRSGAGSGKSPQALVSELVGPLIEMTGCEDYNTLQEALIACDFDVEVAANYLMQLKEAEDLSMLTSQLDDSVLERKSSDALGTPAQNTSSTSSGGHETSSKALLASKAAKDPATARTGCEYPSCAPDKSKISSAAAERDSLSQDLSHIDAGPKNDDSTAAHAAQPDPTEDSNPCVHGSDAACCCAGSSGKVQASDSHAKSANDAADPDEPCVDEDVLLAMQIQEIMSASASRDLPTGMKTADLQAAWLQQSGQSLALSMLDKQLKEQKKANVAQDQRSGVSQQSIKVKASKHVGVKVRKADKKKERKQRRAEERKREAMATADGSAGKVDKQKGPVPGLVAEMPARPDGVPKIVSI